MRDEVLHIGKSKNYLWRGCSLILGIMNARLNLTCLISNIRRTMEACDKELMVNCCWGGGKGQEMFREFGMDICLKRITNKDLLYSTWNSAQCYVTAWTGGEFGDKGNMYLYDCVPSLFTRSCHNIVNYLYLNTK